MNKYQKHEEILAIINKNHNDFTNLYQSLSNKHNTSIDEIKEHYQQPVQELINQNFIETENDVTFGFPDNQIGFNIYTSIGYTTWINQKIIEQQETKIRELNIYEATIKASNAAISSATSAKVSYIVSLLAIIFGIYQYFDAKKSNEELNKINLKLNQLELQLKHLQKQPKQSSI